MASIRIQFNAAGFEQLLTSSGVKELVKGHAEEIADKANQVPSTTSPAAASPYYEVEEASTDRARYRVIPAPGEQLVRNIRHEAKTQALQRALGGS